MSPPLPFFEIIINGILLGGIYALIALGLSVIYGVSNVLNFSHGTFLMFGAVLGSMLYRFSLPIVSELPVLTIMISTALAVLGAAVWHGLIKWLMGKPELQFVVGSVLITVGLMFILEDLMLFTFGPILWSIPFSLPPINIGGIIIPTIRLVALVVVMVLTLALHLFFNRTYIGMSIACVTQDLRGAQIVGIDASKVSMYAFMIGFALAGVAGILYSLMFAVGPFMGLPLTVTAFTIIIFGGIGSIIGLIVGGIILAIGQLLVSYQFGTQWAPVVIVLFLLILLLVRPRGLFGVR